MQRIRTYIHQKKSWPTFTWDADVVLKPLSEVRNLQGRLLGKMSSLGFELRNEALFETLVLDVIKSSEIEGEILPPEQVRSSLASKLGIEYAGLPASDRNVDGMVEMLLDATQNSDKPLSIERLFDWHAGLFPTGRSGIYKITVGDWRIDTKGPMQVVSGGFGKEKIHFEAPDSNRVPAEMETFLHWFNENHVNDPVIKAAIAHLWFVTIHPFEDGNGRITRALTDLLLAKADGSTHRFYSMSTQIRKERNSYYEILEKTQQGNLNITGWILWFLACLKNSLISNDETLNSVLFKADFWSKHAKTVITDRQRMMLNKILDNFKGKLTSAKWAKIAKCSKDTAIRDINDLISKGILQKQSSGGRSTCYEIQGRASTTE